MPLYEYVCDSCGSRFEHINTMENRYVACCQYCGKPAQLVISLSSFQMATPITLRTYDGKILDEKPNGGRIAPPRPTSVVERENLDEI